MVVSRLVSCVEDFVIYRYQVTEFLCSWCWFTTSPSARIPCNLVSRADLAILVFRVVRMNTVLPLAPLLYNVQIWVMRNVCGCWRSSTSSRFSVTSTSHSGRSRKLFPAASLRRFSGGPSLLSEFAGHNKHDQPCGSDVEGELVLEVDDRPGTTTERSSQYGIEFSHFGSDVAFDQWPCPFAELAQWKNGKRVIEQVHSNEEMILVGRYHRDGGSGFSKSFNFTWT